MTSVSALSELSLSFLLLWTFLLCLIGLFGAVLAVSQKRYRFAAFSLIPFAGANFLWQVLFDLHLHGDTDAAAGFSRNLGGYPWICWTALLLALTPVSVLLLRQIIRYGRRSITPSAVKLCLDQMPCGICCWHDSGRVLFSNICMNRLCIALTDSPLLNGNHFYDRVHDGIITLEGKVWRFSCRDISFGVEMLHELIASDITTEYAETQALEKDKAELSRLKRQLQEYGLRTEDAVRRQEILQAKVRIHDEMNKLMLSTMAADKEDTALLDRIFSLWEQNALLLCMQAEESADKKAAVRVDDLAKALGIRLFRQETLPSALTDKQRDLFFAAAQEALINASKHAGADRMEISFTEDDTAVRCTFTNNGNIPAGEVQFVGGLANLRLLAGEQGTSVSVAAGETFTLTLRFPKNQPIG